MKIELNQEKINAATEAVVQRSVEDAIGSHEVSRQIQEQVANMFTSESVGCLISEGVNQIDLSGVAQSIAKEIAKAAVIGARETMLGAFVTVIARLRGWETYDKDYQEKIERLRVELAHGMKEAE